MKKRTKSHLKPVRSSHVPATSGMLHRMEGRLSEKMNAGFERADGKIAGLRSDFQSMKSDIHAIKTDLQTTKADMHSAMLSIKSDMHSAVHVLKSDVQSIKGDAHDIKSELHRVALLVEEQNAKNNFVLDGYAQLYERMARIEGK